MSDVLRILVAALGGEGGGVLTSWIVAAARAAGKEVQATSVPGVAQRTGSTSYYIEIAEPGQGAVFSLVPLPARVDVVLASEMVEAARCMAGGFVSPDLTTLIASTNRVYSTAEKIKLGDGRYSEDKMREAAQAMARTAHLLDLDALATANRTFISATMFGALMGADVLPWNDEVSLFVIGGNQASIDGARAAAEAVRNPMHAPDATAAAPAAMHLEGLPPEVQTIVGHGHDRTVDFQDAAYGQDYLTHVAGLAAVTDMADHRAVYALSEAARRLALWMAYEDVARVADLKTRPERFARIRDEAEVTPDQVLWVTEYLKPRAEEVADILPVGLGAWVMRRVARGRGLPFTGRGVHIRSNGVFGYCLLRLVAGMGRWRRRSFRFRAEMEDIAQWLEAMKTALGRDAGLASALAELPRVLKGYSDTQQRGKAAYSKIMHGIVLPAIAAGQEAQTAQALRHAVAAALADEDHAALDAILSGAEAPDPRIPNLRSA